MSAVDRIAAAPIFWGVCEVPGWGSSADPQQVLAEMRAAGLAATEIGSCGFLPAEPAEMTRVIHELQAGVAAIADGRPSGPSASDRYAAALVSEASDSGRPVEIRRETRPDLYAGASQLVGPPLSDS
jgi:inosose dehydratase